MARFVLALLLLTGHALAVALPVDGPVHRDENGAVTHVPGWLLGPNSEWGKGRSSTGSQSTNQYIPPTNQPGSSNTNPMVIGSPLQSPPNPQAQTPRPQTPKPQIQSPQNRFPSLQNSPLTPQGIPNTPPAQQASPRTPTNPQASLENSLSPGPNPTHASASSPHAAAAAAAGTVAQRESIPDTVTPTNFFAPLAQQVQRQAPQPGPQYAALLVPHTTIGTQSWCSGAGAPVSLITGQAGGPVSSVAIKLKAGGKQAYNWGVTKTVKAQDITYFRMVHYVYYLGEVPRLSEAVASMKNGQASGIACRDMLNQLITRGGGRISPGAELETVRSDS